MTKRTEPPAASPAPAAAAEQPATPTLPLSTPKERIAEAVARAKEAGNRDVGASRSRAIARAGERRTRIVGRTRILAAIRDGISTEDLVKATGLTEAQLESHVGKVAPAELRAIGRSVGVRVNVDSPRLPFPWQVASDE